MSERTRIGLGILAVALGVGALGDELLRVLPWGINVTVCSVALIGGAIWIIRSRDLPTTPEAPWLAITALLFAVAFVRRDSRPLAALDLLGLILALALGALSVQGVRVRLRGVTTYALAVPVAAITAAVGALPLVLGDIRWAEVPRPPRLGQLRAVGLGALLAVPLLGVFTALFASADATFALAAREALHFDATSLASHAFLILFWGAPTAGFLRGALLGRSDWVLTGERLTPGSVGGGIPFATAATALGLVNLLFVVFLGLQASYLFGGAGYVQRATGLTIAEYARHGFFELVTASGLVLPLLLGADWATHRETPQQRTSFRALLGLMAMLVGVMLASALQRMFLYVGAFGLTELRVYTSGFMMWLAGVFAWFAFTVLRGRRASFAFGALVQGWVVLAALHVLNPDAFIARTNLARAVAGQPIGEGGEAAQHRPAPDVRYLAGKLSADAVPELLTTLPRLSPEDQRVVSEALVRRWVDFPARDWRSWNWSASRAANLVREREAGLRAIFQP